MSGRSSKPEAPVYLPERIEVGDIVVCVDGDSATPWLRRGRRFTVQAMDLRPGTEDWYLKLAGSPSTWLRDRFVREGDAPDWITESVSVADLASFAPDPLHDEVNHPSHYRLPNGRETIEITEELDFLRGNAVKYLIRAGKKDGVDELTDLRKAAWYASRAVEKLQRERTEQS
jgi:hypothetical protein